MESEDKYNGELRKIAAVAKRENEESQRRIKQLEGEANREWRIDPNMQKNLCSKWAQSTWSINVARGNGKSTR